jgi:hypothetical protein
LPDLPGLADLLPPLILLAPGYLSLLLLQRASGRAVFTDAFEKTLASLILSGVADALFVALHRAKNWDSVLSVLYANPPAAILDLIVLAAIVAIVTAVVVELDPVSRLLRTALYARGGYVPVKDTAWEVFMDEHQQKFIFVKTHDSYFMGVLWRYSFENEERAVVLARVQELEYDADGQAQTLREFDQLFVPASKIDRIAGLADGTVEIRPAQENRTRRWLIGIVLLVLALLWLAYRFSTSEAIEILTNSTP